MEDDPDLAAGWGGCQAVETEVDVNRIEISAGSVRAEAELNESATAQQVWEALPIDGRANTWGDEIYFEIPVTAEQAPDARAEVEVGELGYWPVGRAFCIFFGPTPASRGDEPRAYSPVNVLGRVSGDATVFRTVPGGAAVRIERAE
ncbi:MAG: cyclophilin-like fold protein [Anaerolineae bacterium]